MASASQIILEFLCPLTGTIIANCMFISAFHSVKTVVEKNGAVALNPTPWAFMLGNGIGWITYSFLTRDLFLFFANAPGFVLSVWFNLSAIQWQPQQQPAVSTDNDHDIRQQRRSLEGEIRSLSSSRRSLMSRGVVSVHNDDKLYQQQLSQQRQQWRRQQQDPPYRMLVEDDTSIVVDLQNNSNSKREIDDPGDEEEQQIEMREHSKGQQQQQQQQHEEQHQEQQHQNQQQQPPQSSWVMKIAEFAALIVPVISQQSPAPARHEKVVMTIVTLWTFVISIVAFGSFPSHGSSIDGHQIIVGFIVNLNMLFFYGAPLSTIVAVIQTECSAPIPVWTLITNTVNGALWMVYGAAIQDPFVSVPNAIGVSLGIGQAILCVVFPRYEGDNHDNTNTNHSGTDSNNGSNNNNITADDARSIISDEEQEQEDDEEDDDEDEEEEDTEGDGELKRDRLRMNRSISKKSRLQLGPPKDEHGYEIQQSSPTSPILPARDQPVPNE